MSPGPHQQHHRAPELDLERKEELILAKQLRACRVNILPRYNQDTCYQLRQPDLSQLHNPPSDSCLSWFRFPLLACSVL